MSSETSKSQIKMSTLPDGSAAANRRHSHTPSAQFYPTHQARASYSVPVGQQSVFAAPLKSSADPDSLTEQVKSYSSKIEDLIDTYSHPVKPYLPAIGRFLIIVTFVEDALRYVVA